MSDIKTSLYSYVAEYVDKFEWGVHRPEMVKFCMKLAEDEPEMWPFMLTQILTTRHAEMFPQREVYDVSA